MTREDWKELTPTERRNMTHEEEEISRFTDMLQSAIVLAGGMKISNEALLKMSLIDLMKLIYPNGVKLLVEFEGKIRR